MPTTDLREELQQARPFASLEQEAMLNILRTAAVLGDDLEQMLRPWGITMVQYNVLRILRGAEPGGLCRNEIRDRMLTRMPDVTRLLDRMEEAGLVTRARSAEDKRMVRTRITPRGRRLVDDLEGPVAAEHFRRLGSIDRAQLRSLIAVLTSIRQAG